MDPRALFPLTCAHLDEAPAAATPDAFVQDVCARHARGDIPSRAVRDLVRYESLLLEMPPATAVTPAAPPPDDATCVLASHVRLLVFGAGLPHMLGALREGKRARPRASDGCLLAWRGADDVRRELVLPREEGWFVERFREPATVEDAVEEDERPLFMKLWLEGVLIRA